MLVIVRDFDTILVIRRVEELYEEGYRAASFHSFYDAKLNRAMYVVWMVKAELLVN